MRDTIDFSGKQSKNLTVTATPNQQFNFSKSDDDTAILSPNCLAYHRKITAPSKVFFLVKLYILLSYEIFLQHTSGAFIFLFHFFHIRWLVKTGNGPVVIAPIWDGKMELCTFLIAEWVGPFSQKSLGENLTCIAWRDPSFPLLTLPMLQKKLTVAKKTIPYFSSTRTLFFYGYQHCYRLKKLELLFVTQAPPFLKFEEWRPPKGIEHSFWRVRELVKKGTTQWCMISCH